MKVFYIILLVLLYVDSAFAATCPAGYTGVDISIDMFIAPTNNHCPDGSYEFTTIPETFVPLYTGFTEGAVATLCDNGFLSGNTCVQYTQGNCRNDYYVDSSLEASMFIAPTGNHCPDGSYQYATNVTDTIYPIYNGFTEGSTATLCGSGYNSSGTTCSQYVQDDCPSDFVNIASDDTLFTTPTAGQCGTDYTTYSINQQCDVNTTDSVCAVLCSDGLLYTDVGTCATLCSAGATSLNMRKVQDGPIISFPLYSTQQSFPSLAFGLENGVCFVNLTVGAADDALNVQKDGVTYHTVR